MTKKEIKLNIGCGPSGLVGWVNYDWGLLPLLSKLKIIRKILIVLKILPTEYDLNWPTLRLVDIRHRFPLEAETVKYVYCSHVLEHFERWEALKILKECWRVLEKGGVIRVIVPDIEKMYQIYQQFVPRRGRELNRLWWGFNKDERPQNFVQRLARRFIRDHKWNYDQHELETLLKEAGFSRIELCDFQEGVVPDIKRLDLEIHKNHSLYTEATKIVE